MRLRTLTGLEREKLEAEYKELMKRIEEYRAILADENLLLGVIKKRSRSLPISTGRPPDLYRARCFDITTEDLIPDENVVITMTHLGYIKRMSEDTFKSQHRGGKASKACRP
mgnify:CR=1 FL=1